MKTVIIVLNYNDFETTNKFVNNIKNYKVLDEIIIVDNHSTDNSYSRFLDEIKCNYITILKSGRNGGYGYGNNIGIKYAIKKYKKCNIIISNPDIFVEEKTIQKLIEDLNSKKQYAVVGPVINTHGVKERGWRLTTGFTELLLTIPILGSNYRNRLIGYKECYFDENIKEVDVVSGCFFIAKSEKLEKINFFDENVFLYYEENIISKKLKELGYKEILDNDCEVIHNHSISINKSHSSLSKYKILKQSQMYYLNNYTKTSKVIKFLIYLIARLTILFKS